MPSHLQGSFLQDKTPLSNLGLHTVLKGLTLHFASTFEIRLPIPSF